MGNNQLRHLFEIAFAIHPASVCFNKWLKAAFTNNKSCFIPANQFLNFYLKGFRGFCDFIHTKLVTRSITNNGYSLVVA